MAPSGFQTQSEITNGRSLERSHRPGYGLENNQQLVAVIPQPPGEARVVAQDQGGWWIPAGLWKWILHFINNAPAPHPGRQDGQTETRPTHAEHVGDRRENSGTIEGSYNTTNYSGNAKSFGQNGKVTINGDIH
ncbi:unnamed protein product [Tuber melanosporum]|jgi:hypothetical protein|uniref:(Perigord truffle) hypothetical protein n=1 Tax=Tuber melanosporum (strain Mel28) TaxID=656061 RepID=D5GID9_TUBMM|nr:uncharacterized protein GSTUM_00008440001 [Tuber melanosporum]CAZ84282.1 unnamed protein product [Tuber melanosporum]